MTEQRKEYMKKWREDNKERLKKYKSEYDKIYYENNQDKRIEYARKYRKENGKKRYEYYKNRYEKDIEFRLLRNMRQRLYIATKKGKNNHTNELIGCSIEELRNHLENKFQEGMNWSNYGKWHIDHIRPCASFDLTDLEQQKECFHYSNLQPLWALDNVRKRDKYEQT